MSEVGKTRNKRQSGKEIELGRSTKALKVECHMEAKTTCKPLVSQESTVEGMNDFSQSHLLVMTPQQNGSVKKGKVRANPLNGLKPEVTANRMQLSSIKHKKVVEGSSNGRFEAVQEKLDQLLDGDGGISKRKDASKGYLKLLLLSGASGDRINGEAIQSNRDLSMILDALLKTKSRAVLNAIINKNGLQMLHNIMKQYRQDFRKTPILRKLLKVLEYLATSKILTSEHINGGPPGQGMESFGESMLSLTEHDDKQVHQIARNFRDRWIRRPVRKHGYMDRDDSRVEYHRSFNCNRFSASHNHRHHQDARPTQAIDCGQQPMLVTTSVDARAQEGCSAQSLGGAEIKGAKKGKRKSRWDQPAETNSHSNTSNAMAIDQPAEVKQWDTSGLVNCCSDDMILSATGANPEDMNHPCEDNKHIAKRLKEDSSDLGRRYFRQQKWNNSKIH